MSYDPKPKYKNSGALFINKRKEKETHPDKQGNIEIECPHCMAEQKYYVSGWDKIGNQSGDPWISLALKPAEDKKAESVTPKAPDPAKHPYAPEGYQEKHTKDKGNAFVDDDIPTDF